MTGQESEGSYRLKPLKWYKKLATDKGRVEAGAFAVEGLRAIRQIMAGHPEAIVEIVAVEGSAPPYCEYPVRFITESQLRSVSPAANPQGPIAVVRAPPDTYSDHLPDSTGHRVVLLEDVQDPGNVGTLVRTAAAFGYSGVVLTDRCADPLSAKCVQSSAGTLLNVWIRRTRQYLDLVEGLKARGFSLVATAPDGGDDASVLRSRERLVLALGSEASGLSKTVLQMADYRFRIPIDRDKAESLNVAASGAICMYLSSLNS
jgi:TrmH family RNA methyltransferase